MKYILCLLFIISTVAHAEPRQLQLANADYSQLNLSDYLVSEKYDGVRGYWDGQQFFSRQGNPIFAPKWFTSGFPNTPLDGELWIGRGQFEQTSAIVRSKNNHKDWQQIRFMVFDAPAHPGTFIERYQFLQQLMHSHSNPYIFLVEQWPIQDHNQLQQQLSALVALGAEGLMLKRKLSHYHGKRTNDLIKVKLWQDTEAIVIAHIAGKGKYEGLMGALLVETANKTRFKIGSGFSLKQRQQPPAIGATITFKYNGFYNNGKPKFATFLRVRPDS
ncbi:DNA ligase [Paraferrimonas sp. SM1919]|uniref:DNA ligase n=1 Tax=Paraferrimonas sp. SM1919 TaxID=2662263 RepID=UPI0013D64B85|nr:DNA ligase [Paraferrimonas sp. SM1919]